MLNFKNFLNEEDQKQIKKTQKVLAKNETSVDPKQNRKIKDVPNTLVDLSIQLKNALVKSYLYKYEIKDRVEKMKADGMSEDDIAKFEELQIDHQTAILTRAADIELQMTALAGSNQDMIELAAKLAGKAKNVAGKEIDDKMKTLVKKQEKKVEKEKEEKEVEKEEKEEKK